MEKLIYKKETSKYYDRFTGEPVEDTNHWLRNENNEPLILVNNYYKNAEQRAKFIETAPEMLMLLEKFLEFDGDMQNHLWCDVERVVRKARGEYQIVEV